MLKFLQVCTGRNVIEVNCRKKLFAPRKRRKLFDVLLDSHLNKRNNCHNLSIGHLLSKSSHLRTPLRKKL